MASRPRRSSLGESKRSPENAPGGLYVVPPGCPLTSLEIAAIRLLAHGMTKKEIAFLRNRGTSTIRTQLYDAYQKLGVTNATQAVVACSNAGWIDSIPDLGLAKADDVAEIERLLADLAVAVRTARRERLTALQHEYLAAFEERLYARTASAEAEASKRSEAAFGRMLAEARSRRRPDGRST